MNNTKNVTVNADQGLFVIPCGKGYSCLGFDVAEKRTQALLVWLNEVGIEVDAKVDAALHGTLSGYNRYKEISALAIKTATERRTIVPTELSKQLVAYEGKRVEVVDCYGEKRRFWVGKSSGLIPVHLEISRRDSSGGPAVMGSPFRSIQRVA